MAEENKQQVQHVQQETQRVTLKDPKKVEAAHNHRKREQKAQTGARVK